MSKMQLRTGLATLALATVLVSACEQGSHPENVEVLRSGDGPQVQDDELLFATLLFRDETGDSVLFDSRAQPGPGTERLLFLDSVATPGSFMEALGTLKQGDSVKITVKAGVFYSEYAQRPVPPPMTEETDLSFTLGVDTIISRAVLAKQQFDQQLMQVRMQMGAMLADSAFQAQVASEVPAIDAYMAKNGLKATEVKDGVRVIVTEMGTGETPNPGDMLSMMYAGYLLDGTYFDTNIVELAQEQGLFNPQRPYNPLDFQLVTGRVISGWHIGIEGLPVGTKATLIIPSPMGYGPRGSGATIPPNSTLVFDVEVLNAESPF